MVLDNFEIFDVDGFGHDSHGYLKYPFSYKNNAYVFGKF